MKRDFFKVLFDEDKGDGKGGAGAAEQKAEPKPEDAPKYSDKQLNDIVAKNSAKEAEKAVAKILELAGVKAPEELAELAKLKKGAGEEDPVKKELDEIKKNQASVTERADRNEAKAEALAAGVKKDALERVVKLAMSPAYDGTISERVGKVLAELPEFIDKTGAAFGTAVKTETQDATQSVLDKARAAAGLAVSAK